MCQIQKQSHATRTNYIVSKLPSEIIVKILLELDWRSILNVQQTCHYFSELVKEHKVVRYHVELGISGMTNGNGTGTIDERLSRLNLYQNRWRELSYVREHTVNVPSGSIWELASGVLAQGASTFDEESGRSQVRKFFFSKLPSDARGNLKRKEWTFEGYDFPIRDFTLDPTQDLLVLMRIGTSRDIDRKTVYRHERYQDEQFQLIVQLHLRLLSTNALHPEAKQGVLAHRLELAYSSRLSHVISVCQDKICVLHTTLFQEQVDQLHVWRWKEGEQCFALESCRILSFSFLTDNHLLFAIGSHNATPIRKGDDTSLRFVICDIEQTSKIDSETYTNAYVATAEFHLPPLEDRVDVVDVLIRCDPPPYTVSELSRSGFAQGMSRSDGVPFVVGPMSRIFVIKITVFTPIEVAFERGVTGSVNLALFIPLRTFLPYLLPGKEQTQTVIRNDRSRSVSPDSDSDSDPDPDSSEEEDYKTTKREIAVEWKDWLPHGSRLLILPEDEPVWVCNVYGMKYVYAREENVHGLHPSRHIVLLDFNGPSVRRWAQHQVIAEGTHGSNSSSAELEVEDKRLESVDVTYPSTIEARRYRIFSEDVTTSVPYSYACMENMHRFDGVMVTEDNIVLVKRGGRKEYGVLTF